LEHTNHFRLPETICYWIHVTVFILIKWHLICISHFTTTENNRTLFSEYGINLLFVFNLISWNAWETTETIHALVSN